MPPLCLLQLDGYFFIVAGNKLLQITIPIPVSQSVSPSVRPSVSQSVSPLVSPSVSPSVRATKITRNQTFLLYVGIITNGAHNLQRLEGCGGGGGL